MTYVDFKCILTPEDNRKQNPEEPSISKYQKHLIVGIN